MEEFMSRWSRMTVVLLLAIPRFANAQQVADSTFDTTVPRPVLVATRPRVLFDEAHHEFHRAAGRYLAFTRLITADGCHLVTNAQPFSAAALESVDVLVIANALGAEAMADPAASLPAFTAAECSVVREWVRSGGALLLIADHSPMGDAAHGLAAAFGVEMRSAYTADTLQSADGNATTIEYRVGRGLAQMHPIIRGRDSTERVRRVVAFTGQSLAGPPEAVSLLTLSAQAEDIRARFGERAIGLGPERRQSAAGRSQGLAFAFGRGRVVVLGEAAMMTAQRAGPDRRAMGMNVPGNDDRQFALNVMRWLAGALR
jgi:hypothetical protein